MRGGFAGKISVEGLKSRPMIYHRLRYLERCLKVERAHTNRQNIRHVIWYVENENVEDRQACRTQYRNYRRTKSGRR